MYSIIYLQLTLGAFTATQVAPDLIRQGRLSPRLVLWACGPFVEFLRDLSHFNNDNGDNALHILVVQGSLDAIVQYVATPERTQQFWSMLPSETSHEYVIAGGTHAGFAHYQSASSRGGTSSKWSEPLEGDGVTILFREDQQRLAVSVTKEFLEQSGRFQQHQHRDRSGAGRGRGR